MRNYASAIINQPHPFEWLNMCASWWADVFTSVSVCARQCSWHNSVAGVWLKQSYAEVVGCFADPSLSVSQEASSIIRDWGTRPPSPTGLCVGSNTLQALISMGGLLYAVHMMSVLKKKRTTDQRQCLIIAQGHLRLSVPTWKINSVILVMPYSYMTVTLTHVT